MGTKASKVLPPSTAARRFERVDLKPSAVPTQSADNSKDEDGGEEEQPNVDFVQRIKQLRVQQVKDETDELRQREYVKIQKSMPKRAYSVLNETPQPEPNKLNHEQVVQMLAMIQTTPAHALNLDGIAAKFRIPAAEVQAIQKHVKYYRVVEQNSKFYAEPLSVADAQIERSSSSNLSQGK